MKKIYTILSLIFGMFFLTGCSSYSHYWHQQEDDVYFMSKTPEDIDVFAYRDSNNDDQWRTIGQSNRNDDWDNDYRRRRRYRDYNPPIIVYPRKGDSETTSPKSEPTKSPTPTRPNRPSKPSKPSKSYSPR